MMHNFGTEYSECVWHYCDHLQPKIKSEDGIKLQEMYGAHKSFGFAATCAFANVRKITNK